VIPSPRPDPRNEDACRQAAAQLQHDHPEWLVMWGCYTRCYVAFPLFQAPRGTVLTAGTPGEMAAQIRRTEQTSGARLPPPSPPGDWSGGPSGQRGSGPQRRPGPPGGTAPQRSPGPPGGPGAPGWPGRR